MGQNYGYLFGSEAKRYPRYFRCLRELLVNGVGKVSSGELAERLGLTPSQVRSDLNDFAGAGQQGYGYSVKRLYTEISRRLGVGDGMTAVIIGGDAELARLMRERFEGRGVTVTAHFQTDGGENGLAGAEELPPRLPFDRLISYLTEHPADVAVVMSRPQDCPDLPEALVTCGVRGVWNLTQKDMILPIPVLNLPVGDILMSLCCDIRAAERRNEKEEETNAIPGDL